MSDFKSNWLAPLLLFLLGLLAIASGAFQLFSIASGPPSDGSEPLMTSPTYFTTPIPIVLHITAGIIFNLMSPLQFVPSFRQKHRKLHRLSGRLLVISGIIAGLSAVWMNIFFPAFGGPLKFAAIFLFGFGMPLTLILGIRAAIKRDIPTHRAWMMRAMALGLGGATQRVYLLPVFIVNGGLGDTMIGLGIWAGFLGNLLFVEWVLRRKKRRKSQVLTFNL